MIRHDAFNRHQIIATGVQVHAPVYPSAASETQYAVEFNGTTSFTNCLSDASIDNLHDNAMTVEAWINMDTWVSTMTITAKAPNTTDNSGWVLDVDSTNGLIGRVACATTKPYAYSGNSYLSTGTWYHVALTWDDASYNYPRLWIDGTERTTTTQNRSGSINSDAIYNCIIGGRYGPNKPFDGKVAWVRISDTVRWTSGFTPNAKDNPPATDGNTVALWTMNEGSGTNVEDVSANTNDGTLRNGGSWVAL
jgi:hypothetical protein